MKATRNRFPPLRRSEACRAVPCQDATLKAPIKTQPRMACDRHSALVSVITSGKKINQDGVNNSHEKCLQIYSQQSKTLDTHSLKYSQHITHVITIGDRIHVISTGVRLHVITIEDIRVLYYSHNTQHILFLPGAPFTNMINFNSSMDI